MAQLTVTANVREEKGRKTDHLRAEGQIPAVVYGFEIEPTSITLDRNVMEKLYQDAGESTVLALDVAGTSHEVLIQDIQRDPLTGFITHADFRKVDMNKKVEAVISLTIVGEAAAVKELGGTLIQNLDEVEVLSLPSALVREIEVDISALKTFDDVVRVKDLNVPEGIEILTDENRSIALTQAPRTEAEMAALDEAVEVDVDSVEVTSEKKEEGEAAEAAGEEKAE